MPRTEAFTHVYPHPWELFTLAYLMRYPNTHDPNVINIDTLEWRLDPKTQTLTAYRWHFINFGSWVPRWFSYITGMRKGAPFVEEVIIDLPNRTMRSRASNLFLRRLVHVDLFNTYVGVTCPDSGEPCTQHTKEASVAARTFGFSIDVEKICQRWFKSRAASKSGVRSMEDAVERAKNWLSSSKTTSIESKPSA